MSLAACATPGPAAAWINHGSGTVALCGTYTTFSASDGCASAQASGIMDAAWGLHATQSGQSSVMSAHPQNFNVPGWDYPVSYATGTALQDPTTMTLPTGCAYQTSGNVLGASPSFPRVYCNGVTTATGTGAWSGYAVISGADFSLHDSIGLIIGSGNTVPIAVLNSRFKRGPNTATVYQMQDSSNQGDVVEYSEIDGNSTLFTAGASGVYTGSVSAQTFTMTALTAGAAPGVYTQLGATGLPAGSVVTSVVSAWNGTSGSYGLNCPSGSCAATSTGSVTLYGSPVPDKTGADFSISNAVGGGFTGHYNYVHNLAGRWINEGALGALDIRFNEVVDFGMIDVLHAEIMQPSFNYGAAAVNSDQSFNSVLLSTAVPGGANDGVFFEGISAATNLNLDNETIVANTPATASADHSNATPAQVTAVISGTTLYAEGISAGSIVATGYQLVYSINGTVVTSGTVGAACSGAGTNVCINGGPNATQAGQTGQTWTMTSDPGIACNGCNVVLNGVLPPSTSTVAYALGNVNGSTATNFNVHDNYVDPNGALICVVNGANTGFTGFRDDGLGAGTYDSTDGNVLSVTAKTTLYPIAIGAPIADVIGGTTNADQVTSGNWQTSPVIQSQSVAGAITAHTSGTSLTIDTNDATWPVVRGARIDDSASGAHLASNVYVVSGSGLSWTLSANVGTISSEAMKVYAGLGQYILNGTNTHYIYNTTTCATHVVCLAALIAPTSVNIANNYTTYPFTTGHGTAGRGGTTQMALAGPTWAGTGAICEGLPGHTP